jgi:hypothetical protein
MTSTRKFVPRLGDIFFAALFIAILLLGGRMINLDGDLPRHLLFGKLILAERAIPDTEPLIYPYENRAYVSHEWLSQVVYQAVYAVAGLPGLVLLAAVLLSSTFFISYNYLVKRFSLRLPVLFVVAWGAFATSLNWAIRPHLFSMFLLALWLVWADRLQRGEEISIWRFPTLMILWSNFHGVFIAGVLVLFAFAVGWTVDYFGENIFVPQRDTKEKPFVPLRDPSWLIGKRLWLALILSIVASVFNPGGAGSWFSILGFVNNQYLMSRMLEANSPNFQLPELRIFFLLLVFSIFLLAVKRGALSSGQGLLLAGFSAMSLMAFRNVHLYGIVAPFVLAEALTDLRSLPLVNRLEATLARVEDQISGAIYPVVTVLVLGALVILSPISKVLYRFEPETFPVDAVRWLESNPQSGRMFNDLNWGGYLALNLHPQKTFVDSVADVTGEVTLDYEILLTASDGWENLLKQYDIEWAVIEPDSPLAHALLERGWEILNKDETAVILRR